MRSTDPNAAAVSGEPDNWVPSINSVHLPETSITSDVMLQTRMVSIKTPIIATYP